MGYRLSELADRCDGKIQGNPDIMIDGVATLAKAGSEHIAFLSDTKHQKYLDSTQAGAVILRQHDVTDFSGNAIICDNPHLAFALIANLFDSYVSDIEPGIHSTACIDKDANVAATATIASHVVIEAGAVIADGVKIGPGCHIEKDVRIGSHTHLYAHVVVRHHCEIGDNCIVHPGAVIGSDGFGYAKDGSQWCKVPQLGRVIIGNEVEIGSNTTIDRGALDDTIIGDRVKLDNLIQVAHNVTIGDDTIIAACVGIAGSTTIGKRCAIGGQAGILGHKYIVDDVQIAAKSLVTNSIKKPGIYASNIKAIDLNKWQKNVARLYDLDEMAKRLRQLEQTIKLLSRE